MILVVQLLEFASAWVGGMFAAQQPVLIIPFAANALREWHEEGNKVKPKYQQTLIVVFVVSFLYNYAAKEKQ